MAARPDYEPWDLVNATPLLTSRGLDTSGRQWDADRKTGLREAGSEVVTVEYWRDIKPILERSCAACHSSKTDALAQAQRTDKAAGQAPDGPAGNLDLDAASFRGLQFSQVQGPLEITDKQILFGTRARRFAPGDRTAPLTATLFGGVATADAICQENPR